MERASEEEHGYEFPLKKLPHFSAYTSEKILTIPKESSSVTPFEPDIESVYDSS